MPINSIADLTTSQLQSGTETQQANALRIANESKLPVPREAGANETVTLSDAAQRLGQLENRVKALPVTDTQMVERGRQALNSNPPEINPARIADQLINMERTSAT